MEYEKAYSCIEKNEKKFAKSIDIEMDFSETIPAYCDDVFRIVKCTSHSFINSVSISDNEILIFGKTEIMLTYYNENSCLCYADFDEEFQKNIPADNFTDYAFAKADISDKYTNFRIINQRRIDVHTSSVLSLTVYDKTKYPCLNACDNSKLNKQYIKSADIIASNISKIEFDEEFSLPADSQPVKRIISADCSASLIETKIIKDKALVKVDAEVRLLYTVGDDSESIQSVSNSFNLSKIIEQSSIEEGDISICNVAVGTIYNKSKASSGDKFDTIEVFGEIEINTVFIRETEKEYITDGYIPKRSSECSYSEIKMISNGREESENKISQIPVELSDEIKGIKDVGVNLSSPVVRNRKLVSKADIMIIYDSENDSLKAMSTSAEIEYDLKGFDNAVCAGSLKSVDYTILGDKGVNLRLNTDMTGYFYNEESVQLLSDIIEGEEQKEVPSLTICFAKQNDSVWNIAKSFSSDEEMIMKENNLQKDIIEKDSILIIPRV